MGSDAIARPLLDWLAEAKSAAGEVVGVFTQPDRPAGRGQQVQVGAIKAWAQGRGLPVLQPAQLGEGELAQLRQWRPDVILVMAYGHILRRNFIDAPPLGTLNLHASLLPQFRGASPIQTAVACGGPSTGVTLMRIVPELDAGPVAGSEVVPILPLDTAADVEVRLAAACGPLLARTLPELAAGRLKFSEQDHARATFCRRLEKSDGALDFSAPAAALAARINGLFPWPGCSFAVNGQVVRLGLADTVAGPAAAAPGAVLGSDAAGLLVAAGGSVLRLRRLQRPGGRMLDAGEFLRGFPIAAGTVVPSQPMPPLVSTAPFPRPPRG